MAIEFEIPSALAGFTNNQSSVQVSGSTIQQALDSLLDAHGALRPHLLDENGEIRSFINIYVNDQDIRHAEQLATSLKDGDVLQIVPSIAGGR